MSWRFVSTHDSPGLANRQAVLDRIARWWPAFAEKLPEIEPGLAEMSAAAVGQPSSETRVLRVSQELSEWMDAQIAAIHPQLQWEFGREAAGEAAEAGEASGGEHYLVITPGEHLGLRPMTESILAGAPQRSGWRFLGWRPPLPAVHVSEAIRLRTGQTVIAPTAIARLGSYNRVDLVFKLALARTDERAARVVATALAEAVAGEEFCARWIGEIDVEPPDRGVGGDRYLGMSQLRGAISGLTRTIGSGLPAGPLHSQRAPEKWPTLKFGPSESPDYPLQFDVTVGRTLVPEIRAAALGEGPGRRPARPF